MSGLLASRRCVGVFHPVDAVGAPERDDLARAVTGPLVASSAVGQSEIKDLAGFGQGQRRCPRLIRERIERADLVVLAPCPSPSLSLLPTARSNLPAPPLSRFLAGWSRRASAAPASRRAPHGNTAAAPMMAPKPKSVSVRTLCRTFIVDPLLLYQSVTDCRSPAPRPTLSPLADSGRRSVSKPESLPSPVQGDRILGASWVSRNERPDISVGGRRPIKRPLRGPGTSTQSKPVRLLNACGQQSVVILAESREI